MIEAPETMSLRDALAASYLRLRLLAYAQCSCNGRQYEVTYDGTTWLLTINGFAFPFGSLDAIERVLSTGTRQPSVHEGWLGQAPAGDPQDWQRLLQ